jgi:hypothetical protein
MWGEGVDKLLPRQFIQISECRARRATKNRSKMK